MSPKVLGSLLVLTLLACACGAPAARGAGYPAREAGCEVKVFADAPPGHTDNIGPVSAHCTTDVSREDCLRTLKDQACKVGADILWGVSEQGEQKDGKQYFYGRAAKALP
jgi:hypothetical protein